VTLERHATCRRCSGEIAVRIERDGADGALGGHQLGDGRSFELPAQLERSLGRAKVGVRDQRDALIQREFLGPLADDEHVTGLLHDAPRELYRIADMTYGRHRTRPLSSAFHDRGI
jgi:hypothetical protein